MTSVIVNASVLVGKKYRMINGMSPGDWRLGTATVDMRFRPPNEQNVCLVMGDRNIFIDLSNPAGRALCRFVSEMLSNDSSEDVRSAAFLLEELSTYTAEAYWYCCQRADLGWVIPRLGCYTPALKTELSEGIRALEPIYLTVLEALDALLEKGNDRACRFPVEMLAHLSRAMYPYDSNPLRLFTEDLKAREENSGIELINLIPERAKN